MTRDYDNITGLLCNADVNISPLRYECKLHPKMIITPRRIPLSDISVIKFKNAWGDSTIMSNNAIETAAYFDNPVKCSLHITNENLRLLSCK